MPVCPLCHTPLPDVSGDLVGPSTASATSRAAAYAIKPRSGTKRAAVLIRIRDRGNYGATRDELTAFFAWPDSTVDARVSELLKGKWIQKTNRTRQTRAGRRAEVLVCTVKALLH